MFSSSYLKVYVILKKKKIKLNKIKSLRVMHENKIIVKIIKLASLFFFFWRSRSSLHLATFYIMKQNIFWNKNSQSHSQYSL